MLSEETKKILKEYGWSPNRKVEVLTFTEMLRKEGYEVFDSAVQFLSNFGGLHLKMPNYRTSGWADLHFDPVKAAGRVFIENVQDYEKRVGEKLIPVGEAYNGYFVLMLSESGKMYGAFDDFLTLEGENYEEAIEKMFKRIETPEIK